MKSKIVITALFLVIMAILPLATVMCSDIKSDSGQTSEIKSKSDNNYNFDEIVCGLTAARYREGYCDETIKAISILMNTDYTADKNSFDISDPEICLFQEEADNSAKEKYTDIEQIVNSAKELTLWQNGEIKYVPYSETSNGNTIKSDSYDYLCAVASPWDCFDKNFDEQAECVGVSIGGIDYLCQNGMSAEEALKWYLPNFEVQKGK